MVGARGVGVGGLGILTRRSLTGGGGGTADALASGASEGNLVEVQILSAAPERPFEYESDSVGVGLVTAGNHVGSLLESAEARGSDGG